MKKITCYLIVFICMLYTWQGEAQLFKVSECNSGVASNTYGPMNSVTTADANNRHAVIYPSSQLSDIGGTIIDAIYFWRAASSGTLEGNPNFKIYLKETTASDFGSADLNWNSEITGATLVYDSDPTTETGSSSGWKKYSLSNSFTYSGTQNLAVFMEYSNSSAMSTSITWYYEYSSPCINTSNSTTTKYSTNTTGVLSSTLSSQNYRRPHIGFDYVITCASPQNVQNTSVGSNTADFSWDPVSNASGGYTWVIMDEGDIPDVNSSVDNNLSSTTTAMTNLLSQGETYDFYVQADCGTTDGMSSWEGPVSFTTQCNSFTAPYSESFDNDFLPICWQKADAGTPSTGPSNFGSSGGWIQDEYLNESSNSNAVNVNLFSDSKEEWLISPQIDISGSSYYLKYFAAETDFNNSSVNEDGGMATTDDEVQVLISTNNGSTWQNLRTYNSTNIVPLTGKQELIDLSSYTGMIKIAFWASEGTADDDADYDFFIDEFEIDTNSCVAPNTLTVANVTDTNADLGWTAGASETSWNLEVVTAGTVPTGTPTDSGVSNPYTASSLTASTEYDFYVQAVCGAEVSSWSGPLTFKTTCGVFTAPYLDDVESHATTTSLGDSECWTTNSDSGYDWNIDGSGSTPSSSTGPSGAYSGSNYFYTEGSSGNIGDEAELISPNIDISSLSSPALKFYYHMYGEFIGTLNVDVYDGSNWNNSVYSITGEQQTSGSDAWKEQLVNLSSYSGVIQVRFRAVSNGNSTDYEGDISIDDISIEEGPTCYAPTNLSVSNITAYTADLSWDDINTVTPSSWDIEYDIAGFTPTGTPNVSPSPSTNSYNLMGLSSDTDYEFYVRTDCGGGDTSTWSGPYAFTTLVSCMEPTNLVLNSLEDTNATFSWDAVANATNGYNWVVMADGDDPTTDTPLQNGSVASGVTTIKVMGLTSETDYDFYVQADCGSTDGTSTWLGPANFRTLCVSISAPFFEDVESHTATTSFNNSECWYTVQGSYGWDISDDDTPSSDTGPNQAYSGTNFFFTEGSSGSVGDVAELYSPLIDVSSLSSPAVEFYYHMFNGDDPGDMGELHFDVYDGTTWNNDVINPLIGGQQAAQGDPWLLQAIDLSSYTGIIQVRFRAIRGNDYESDISIDDINIFDYSCMAPTNITSSNVTTTTADFSWTASPDDTSGYEYIVMLDGETPGVDTPVDTGVLATGITSVSISNLSPGVDYDFYIRTLCSLDNPWSTVEDFTTALPPCDLPTAITNTSVTTTTADFSWTASADETNGYIWIVMADGDDPLVDSPVDNGTVATGITNVQVIGLTPGTAYDFYLQTDCGSGTVSILSNKVDFMTDNYPCVPPASISNNAITETTAKFTWQISGLETGGYNWVLMANGDDPTTDMPLFNGSVGTGVTSVVVSGLTPMTDYDFYVQTVCASEDSGWSTKVDITTLSPCLDPSGITISSITDSSADITWTENGSATEWEIEYGSAGFSQGSGTLITDDDGILGETIFTLMADTNYDVYVRAICTGNNQSNWTGPETFTTEQLPCEIPTEVSIGNITENTADVTWTENGTATEWEILYGEAGFDPNSAGSSVMDTDGTIGETLTGLDPDTAYDVYIRAMCSTDNMSDWSDVESFTTEDLGINDIAFQTLSLYPNPVKSNLTISAKSNVEQLELFSLLGQKVKTLSPNSTQTQLDLSGLSSGTYLLKVTINDSSKTFRIIKE